MKPRQVLSLVLLAVVLVLGTFFVWRQWDDFKRLFTVPLAGIAALAAAKLLSRAIEAMTLRLIAEDMGKDIGVLESNLLSWTVMYWNYLPMKPGTGAQALYLKRRHDLAYSDFVAYVMVVQILRAMAIGIVGVAACLPLALGGRMPLLIPALFAGLVAASLTVMLVPVRWRYTGRNRVLRALSRLTRRLHLVLGRLSVRGRRSVEAARGRQGGEGGGPVLRSLSRLAGRARMVLAWSVGFAARALLRVSRAWELMRGRRRLFVRIALWRVFQVLVLSVQQYLSFNLVGLAISIPQAVVLVPLAGIGSLVAVFPAGLGLTEAMIGWAGVGYGYAFAEGVVASALSRAVSLLLVLAIGPVASHRIFMHFFPSRQMAAEAAAVR